MYTVVYSCPGSLPKERKFETCVAAMNFFYYMSSRLSKVNKDSRIELKVPE